MNTYALFCRRGWQTPEDVEAAALISKRVADQEMHGTVSWISSYVFVENDRSLGFVCIYRARNEGALRRHADAAGLPIDEIVPVVDTIAVRTDPAHAAANKEEGGAPDVFDRHIRSHEPEQGSVGEG